MLGHIIIKLLENSGKEKFLKAIREKDSNIRAGGDISHLGKQAS